MLIVISIAGAAALAVVAYTRLRQHSPETSTAGLRAVRELAAIVVVCTKAVEGVVDVLAGTHHQHAPIPSRHHYDPDYDPQYGPDYEDDQL